MMRERASLLPYGFVLALLGIAWFGAGLAPEPIDLLLRVPIWGFALIGFLVLVARLTLGSRPRPAAGQAEYAGPVARGAPTIDPRELARVQALLRAAGIEMFSAGRATRIALDMSIAREIPMEEAARIIIAAIRGEAAVAARAGIVLPPDTYGDEALEILRRRFAREMRSRGGAPWHAEEAPISADPWEAAGWTPPPPAAPAARGGSPVDETPRISDDDPFFGRPEILDAPPPPEAADSPTTGWVDPDDPAAPIPNWRPPVLRRPTVGAPDPAPVPRTERPAGPLDLPIDDWVGRRTERRSVDGRPIAAPRAPAPPAPTPPRAGRRPPPAGSPTAPPTEPPSPTARRAPAAPLAASPTAAPASPSATSTRPAARRGARDGATRPPARATRQAAPDPFASLASDQDPLALERRRIAAGTLSPEEFWAEEPEGWDPGEDGDDPPLDPGKLEELLAMLDR